MEFIDALTIIKKEKECASRSIFCGGNCVSCELITVNESDRIEAFQMAVFALEQLIENEA